LGDQRNDGENNWNSGDGTGQMAQTWMFMMMMMMKSTIRLYADDCVIYRKIINNADIKKLQKELDRLGEWAVENAMKINPSKSKAIRFTRARVKDPLNYSLMGTLIPEANSCKYLGIILRSDLIWADQVNYAVKKACEELHFTMRILK